MALALSNIPYNGVNTIMYLLLNSFLKEGSFSLWKGRFISVGSVGVGTKH